MQIYPPSPSILLLGMKLLEDRGHMKPIFVSQNAWQERIVNGQYFCLNSLFIKCSVFGGIQNHSYRFSKIHVQCPQAKIIIQYEVEPKPIYLKKIMGYFESHSNIMNTDLMLWAKSCTLHYLESFLLIM